VVWDGTALGFSGRWRSRGRPRASFSLARSLVNCARSTGLPSLGRSARSFLRDSLPLCSRVVTTILSRVRGRSSARLLRSLRSAAASRSGQSARLTNSKCPMTSSSSSATERELIRRREGEQALENARGLMTSVAGNDTDSLNNWRESATLRPIPAALF